ncbi:MAG: hypothetical protein K0S61_4935 [Anaerocolumna sp.]|nr:hypothetical protein [Anaerocolumna sp.]
MSKRIKQRTGLPKRAHIKFIKRFFQKGLDVSQTKIRNLNLYYYLKGISRDGYVLKILGIYILVASDNGIGITLLKIPKEYQKIKRGEYIGNSRSNKESPII